MRPCPQDHQLLKRKWSPISSPIIKGFIAPPPGDFPSMEGEDPIVTIYHYQPVSHYRLRDPTSSKPGEVPQESAVVGIELVERPVVVSNEDRLVDHSGGPCVGAAKLGSPSD